MRYEYDACGCVAVCRATVPAPASACMCGVEGSRPQPLTQASALKETESGEARAALTICVKDRVFNDILGRTLLVSQTVERDAA